MVGSGPPSIQSTFFTLVLTVQSTFCTLVLTVKSTFCTLVPKIAIMDSSILWSKSFCEYTVNENGALIKGPQLQNNSFCFTLKLTMMIIKNNKNLQPHYITFLD